MVALILAVVAVSVWYTQTRQDTSASGECINGELILPVASSQPDAARDVIDAYNSADRVVRDYCVTASLADNVADAGVYLAAESDQEIQAVLAQAGRSAATLEWPVVATEKVGFATQDAGAEWAEEAQVRYPTASDPLAAALVATAQLGEDANAVAQALSQDTNLSVEQAVTEGAAFAVSASNVPEGWTFVEAPDTFKPLRAVALNTTDAVDEEKIRAGADFGQAIALNGGTELPQGFATAAEALAALSSEGTLGASVATGQTQPQDVLFLMDTSQGVAGEWFNAEVAAITRVAAEVGEGRALGLWNYSSPLSEGVTAGWRNNVALGVGNSADSLRDIAQAFGTGGQPQTRSAVAAALLHAADYAVQTGSGQPVTVLAFTSGTTDEMNVMDVVPVAQQAQVRLVVLSLGANEPDENLAEAAEATGGKLTQVTDVERLPEIAAEALATQ
ncbi:VWA domain-containing protein [Corynebacterium sp. 35RC1]|nr:VWA domain-containing protein [Corynebacterium sp. 35RC1]